MGAHLKRTPLMTCQALGAGCCRCVSAAAASPPPALPLLVTYGEKWDATYCQPNGTFSPTPFSGPSFPGH